jgi:hypothetical protein
MKETQYDPLFQAAGEKYGVDPSILRAIASVESNFNPQAVGPKTRSGRAQGMMQFVPATAKAYGLEDPFNPEQSVDAAARLMRDLQKQFKGDVGKALEAYNGGPRLVGKSKQTAKYREMVLARAGRGPSDEIPTPAEPIIGAKSAPNELKQGQMYGEAPKPRPEAPRTVSMGTIEAMPLNYRTAFALQYLSETEPDQDPEAKANDLMARLDELEASDGSEGKSSLLAFFSEDTKTAPTAFEIIQSKKQGRQQQKKRSVPSMQVVRGFADGGEVDLSEQMTVGTLPKDAKDYRELLKGLKKSAADIRRGIQYFPADVVGAPVDIANMVLTPFGLGSDKPFMGSEYLIDKGVQAGIYEKPSESGVETLTRMAGLPAFATRSVGRGIASLEESLKGPPEGIVRPYGGASSVARVGQDDDQSMQYGIYYAMKDLGGLPFENKQAQDAAMRMFDVKARNWFNEQAGTANDPLKQKLYSGKIKPFDPNDKLFPAHLLEAARKAKGEIRESAQVDLEDRYDLMLGVRRIVPEDDTLTASERNTRANQAVIEDRRRILQQLKENPDLILDEHLLTVFKNKDPDKLSDAEHLKQVRDKLREAPDIFSARVEPFISKLITSPAERIGVDVIEKSAKYGDIAKEAARRGETFTHGLAAGKISPRNTYNFMHGGPNLFGRSFRELASVAPSIPTKELEKMSFPDFVERSMLLLRKKDEAKNIGQTAQRMLEQDITRALPPELMLKGMSKSPAVSSPPTGTVPNELGTVSSLGWHKLEEPQYANTIALTMKNSVGGYGEYGTYGATSKGRKALETGEAEVYVLYDDKLRPHMTAEIVKDPKSNEYRVYQITGNGPLTSNARHSPYLQGAIDEFTSWVNSRKAPVQKAMGGLVSKPLYDRA